MAKKSNNIVDDIADITSKFPWWIGVTLALVSFLFLHWYANKAISVGTVTGVDGLYKSVLPSLLRAFAVFGQIILPVAFLLGSITSFIIRIKREKLYEKTSRSISHDPLNNMSWQDFEILVGEYFRRRQFNVEETKAGPDGGVDLIATKGREKYLIQCKRWTSGNVGVKVVRELLGVMVGVGATGGFVIISGEFTKDAIDFAKDNNIILLNGKDLHKTMKSFSEYENQSDKKKSGKLQKITWVFIVLLLVAICYSFLHSKTGSSFYSNVSSQISALFSNVLDIRGVKDTQISKPSNPKKQKDSKYTDDQVSRAVKELLIEKKSEQPNDIKQGKRTEEQKYLYEIELFTGGLFFTDNVVITEKEVTYKSDKGLIVSLNRNEIKTIKKIDKKL